MALNNDLTGQYFGRLKVIERVEDYIEKNGNKRSQWLCECKCGNRVKVIGKSLKNGNTKSCGCLQKEITSKHFKNYNDYDLSG